MINNIEVPVKYVAGAVASVSITYGYYLGYKASEKKQKAKERQEKKKEKERQEKERQEKEKRTSKSTAIL